ncbi:hypothetical protein AB0A70_33555 [Streptomyces morookaense]|uniref:hypothetical protein n=1 Tax=Streptomyces morookaense TaxID=1970 RepID=UPI0033D2B2EE
MKTARLTVAALAAALALTATPLASAMPGGGHAKPKHLDLGNKDNRQSFTVHKGEEIDIHLSGEQNESSTWAWSTPTAADDKLLHRDTARMLPNGDATAVFHARADGTTTLDSQFRCRSRSSGQVCSHAVVQWQVTVKVRK